MPNNPIQIVLANESDMLVIQQVAKQLDLDCKALSADQFLVAKSDNRILGFGRIRRYADCSEIATVGVVPEVQQKGIGTLLVKALIAKGPAELFVTCVVPYFFNKLGFKLVKQYPAVLQKKVDFCKEYDFTDEQLFVMKFTK